MKHAEGGEQLATVGSAQKNEDDEKGEPKRSSVASGKSSGKQIKDNAGSPKEDYIHVRARRGQATNSHSLAERVGPFFLLSNDLCRNKSWLVGLGLVVLFFPAFQLSRTASLLSVWML